MDEQPSLGQLIWLVRRELEWAHAVDADHPLRFDVGTVELNVDVEAKRATEGEADPGAWRVLAGEADNPNRWATSSQRSRSAGV
jgi:hypothetical protein